MGSPRRTLLKKRERVIFGSIIDKDKLKESNKGFKIVF